MRLLKCMIVLLLIASPAWAAITDRYVNSAGSGSADGSSFANAMSYATFTDYMVTGGSYTAAAGDRFLIIGGATYSRTTTSDTWVNGGSSTSPVIVRGVDSSGNAITVSRTGGNGALSTTGWPVISYSTGSINVTGSWILLDTLSVSGAPTSVAVVRLNASNDAAANCTIENTATSAGAAAINASSSHGKLLNCDFTASVSTTDTCAVVSSTSCVAVGCRITGGDTQCVLTSSTASIVGCVIYGSLGAGIAMNSTSGSPVIANNTIVGNSGDGIDIITGTTSLQTIVGNLITDNGGYGIDGVSSANAILAAYNRIDRNTSGAINLATDWLAATSWGHNTTSATQANEYTNYGSYDYSLKTTSPAKGVGLMLYMDIGALQRQETASGGGTSRARVVNAN